MLIALFDAVLYARDSLPSFASLDQISDTLLLIIVGILIHDALTFIFKILNLCIDINYTFPLTDLDLRLMESSNAL